MPLFQLIFYFAIVIPSAILHEIAHGAMADSLGDPTARYAGRLTLNPLAHIDMWGTILLPLFLSVATGGQFMFAYAKPVPYNPYNLRNQRWGSAAVAAAGPLANFALAFAFGAVMRLFPYGILPLFLSVIVSANIVLGVFNLVPIPPLDGSKVFAAAFPRAFDRLAPVLGRYGFIILIFFILFAFQWLSPIISALFRLATGSYRGF